MKNCFKSGKTSRFDGATPGRKAYHVRMRSDDTATDAWLSIAPRAVARREDIADDEEDDEEDDKSEDDDDTEELTDDGYSE
jgi:hypothetical protein